ncbi:hypothetical protein ISR94_01785 [Candidatus Microgenomates bacterium]|nr:hypothetical protein [Candidatus Microgenomates bacterium]
MVYSKGQLKIASEFSNDIAKGVMIAVILGQGIINIDAPFKIYINLLWFSISILLFISAMIFSRSL